MARTVANKQLIRVLRTIAECESFIERFLRGGLGWPVLRTTAVNRADDLPPPLRSVRRIECEPPAPPFDVFIAEAVSGAPQRSSASRNDFWSSVAGGFPAASPGRFRSETILVFVVAGPGEFGVMLRDCSTGLSGSARSAWIILPPEAHDAEPLVLETFLQRLSWPADSEEAHSPRDWEARWHSAFDKSELQRRFLRAHQRYATRAGDPASTRDAVLAKLQGRTSTPRAAAEFLNRFSWTQREDTDDKVQLAIDPSILAALHESGSSTAGSTPAAGLSGRKQAGRYFTPPEVAHFMCRDALGEYLSARLTAHNHGCRDENRRRVAALLRDTQPADQGAAATFSGSDADVLRKAVFACRVCDPAVGGGALLVAMLHEMAECVARLSPEVGCGENERLAVRRRIAESCLFGLDVDATALETCRQRLRFAVQAVAQDEKRVQYEPRGFRDHLRQADALLDPWEEVFDNDCRFDIVIANPPYRSYGLRGNRNAKTVWARTIRARYPASAEYKISLYALFFELGLRICRRGGVLCYLTPDSFLLGRYFSKLRRLLLGDSAIRRIVMFRSDFWKAGVVGRPTITLLQAGADSGRVEAMLAEQADTLRRGTFRRLDQAQSEFQANPHSRFRLYFSAVARDFVHHVETGSEPLTTFARISTGVRSRTSQKHIVAGECRGPQWQPGLVSGAQVTPFAVQWRGDFLKIDADELYAGGWNPDVIGHPKILIRQTGDSLIAAIDVQGYYHLNNIHALSPLSGEVSLPYLCALLNSRLMNRYYHLISLEQGRTMAQTDIETIGRLPVRVPSPQSLERVETLVRRSGAPESRAELDALIASLYDPAGLFHEYLGGDDLYPDSAAGSPSAGA